MSPELLPLFKCLVDDFSFIGGAKTDLKSCLDQHIEARETEIHSFIGDFAVPVERLSDVAQICPHRELKSPLSIAAVAGSHGGSWAEDRHLDAQLLQKAIDDSALEISSYVVALERVEDMGSLRGFADAVVMVQAPTTEIIGAAANFDWLRVYFDAASIDPFEELPRFLVECNGLEVPYQIQNLSGCIRTEGKRLGLINVCAASAMAFAEDLSAREIAGLLGESSAIQNTADLQRHLDSLGLKPAHLEECRTIFWGVGVTDFDLALTSLRELFR